jgi:hypothetical protein
LRECLRDLPEGRNHRLDGHNGSAGSVQPGELTAVRRHVVERQLARKRVSRLDLPRCNEAPLQSLELRGIHADVSERFSRLPFARQTRVQVPGQEEGDETDSHDCDEDREIPGFDSRQ